MKIYFFSIFLYCLYFIHCNLRNSNMRRNQAAVVSFDRDRQYLALSLGSTFRLSNIAVTEGTVTSFYIDAGESPKKLANLIIVTQ